MEKKLDARVAQTEAMVRDALVRLMEKKPIEKISVTALCNEAAINRNTFYAHYSRPEDVLKQIFGFWELDINNFNYFDDPKAIVEQYIHLLTDHPDLLLVVQKSDILHNKLIRGLLDNFQKRAVEAWTKLRPALTEEELNKRYLYAEGGSIAILLNWVEQGMVSPSEEIAAVILDYAMKFCGDIWEKEGQSRP